MYLAKCPPDKYGFSSVNAFNSETVEIERHTTDMGSGNIVIVANHTHRTIILAGGRRTATIRQSQLATAATIVLRPICLALSLLLMFATMNVHKCERIASVTGETVLPNDIHRTAPATADKRTDETVRMFSTSDDIEQLKVIVKAGLGLRRIPDAVTVSARCECEVVCATKNELD